MHVNELSYVVTALQALNRWTVSVDFRHSYRAEGNLWVTCCDFKNLTPEDAAVDLQVRLEQKPADFPRYYTGTHKTRVIGGKETHRIEIGCGYRFSIEGVAPYVPVEKGIVERVAISYSKTHWPEPQATPA